MESALIAVLRSMTICGLQDGYERVAASERQDVSADDRAILGVCGNRSGAAHPPIMPALVWPASHISAAPNSTPRPSAGHTDRHIWSGPLGRRGGFTNACACQRHLAGAEPFRAAADEGGGDAA